MSAEIAPQGAQHQTIESFARRTRTARHLLAVMRAHNEEMREAAIESRRLVDESRTLLKDVKE